MLSALVEGCSIRSTERMTGVNRETIGKLLVRVGDGCASLLHEKMQNLACDRLEIDELWSYVAKKQRQVRNTDVATEVGDQWVYIALDADTKLIPSFLVGKRNAENTNLFIADVAARLRGRVQISTDGLRYYADAIADAFGEYGVDYAQIVKSYETDLDGEGRYSPPRVSSTEKTPVFGAPVAEDVSTSYVERQNLTMRMSMRRFTRLTNAFSKKLENHCAAVALHIAHYNLCRLHKTLRAMPAMAAGVESVMWEMDDLLDAALERVA